MSEEHKSGDAEKKGGGSSSMGTIILIVGVILVAAIAALVLYKLVFAPMLAGDEGEENGNAVEQPVGNPISPTAVTEPFDEAIASVKMPPDSDLPASILSFQVALECANPQTQALVAAHKARFTDMINRQHEFKTRAELDDPRIKESIQKAILLEANTILKQLQPEKPNPDIRITAVFHTRFFVHDQI